MPIKNNIKNNNSSIGGVGGSVVLIRVSRKLPIVFILVTHLLDARHMYVRNTHSKPTNTHSNIPNQTPPLNFHPANMACKLNASNAP
jgi:hypothetical protein